MGFWYTNEVDALAKTNLLYKADAEIRRIIAEKDARLEVARKNYDAAIDAARKAREDEQAAARTGDTEERHEATVAITMAERDLTTAEAELEAAMEAAEYPRITEETFSALAAEMYRALDAVGSKNSQRIEKIASELKKMRDEEDKIIWEAHALAMALDDLTGRKIVGKKNDGIGFYAEFLNTNMYMEILNTIEHRGATLYRPGSLVEGWKEREAMRNGKG